MNRGGKTYLQYYKIKKKRVTQMKIPDRHQNAIDMASWQTENDSLDSTAEHFWHLENKTTKRSEINERNQAHVNVWLWDFTPSDAHLVNRNFGKVKINTHKLFKPPKHPVVIKYSVLRRCCYFIDHTSLFLPEIRINKLNLTSFGFCSVQQS